MKSKQLHKVAMIVSCMNFLQSTAPDAYQVHLRFLTNNEQRTEHHINLTKIQRAIITTSREKMITVNGHQKVIRTNGLGLGDDNAKIIESFLSGDTEIRPTDKQVVLTQTEKDEIARNGFSKEFLIRLERDINSGTSSGKPFYSLNEALAPAGIQIEDGKLIVNCAVMRPFRVESIEKRILGYILTSIHIFEPGIESNILVEVFRELGNNLVEGTYSDWREVLTDIQAGDLDGAWLQKKGFWHFLKMVNLDQMPHLFHILNFSRSLASQADITIKNIRSFLCILQYTGFAINQTSIIQDSDQHYSLNLMYHDTLMASLRFKDESEGSEWYSSEYKTARHIYSDERDSDSSFASDNSYCIFPESTYGRKFSLKSIMLMTHTYEIKNRIILNHASIKMIDFCLRGHMRGLITLPHTQRMDEAYNQINLEAAMQPIEFISLFAQYYG